ncbi:MAG: nodulation protein NfeD [Clostridia bacterium]|nr:nodulation protein NfeD [Clostridia bacterium]
MRIRTGVLGVAFLVAVGVLTALAPGSCQAAARVYVVPINGQIEMGVSAFLARGIRDAQDADADALVIEIDTPGGLVDAAIKMRDAIVSSGIPTIAYVNSRAWSAGALITLACDVIAMAPGGSMGAAETRPKEEKYISAFRAEFEATAELRGRDPKVAGAMVDADVDIPGLVERGKILTLTALKAKEIGFIDHTVTSLDDLLAKEKMAGAEVTRVKPTSAEWLGRAISNEAVSGVLLTIGLLGLAIELVTPGFGVPGTLGLVSLALFFGGRMMGGAAGWEAIVLFIVGLAMLLLEVFVIPGFGVTGILGIVSIFASILFSYPTPGQAMTALGIAFTVTVVLVGLLIHFMGRHGKDQVGSGRIVLGHSETPDRGYVAVDTMERFLGKDGIALTPLRPVGAISVDGTRMDAVSEGAFIPAGTRVHIVEVEGYKIMVRPIIDEREGAASDALH